VITISIGADPVAAAAGWLLLHDTRNTPARSIMPKTNNKVFFILIPPKEFA
jgi:hypothetical protein